MRSTAPDSLGRRKELERLLCTMKRLARGSVMALLCAGCGSVLTPVTGAQQAQAITVTTRPPRVVWVVDRSGSMSDPLAPGGPPKIELLRRWFGIVSDTLTAPARHGLALFPSGSFPQCDAPAAFANDVPDAGAGSLAAVVASIDAVQPGGGTPTAATLRLVASALPPDPTTRTLVVLVTDGLPNCNASNSATCGDAATCRCTLSSCGTVGSTFCRLGCLDEDGTTAASIALADAGFELLVVGLGEDVSGANTAVLRSLAQPLARRCASDAECHAGSTCDQSAGLCNERFFQVTSAADFTAPLERLREELHCAWFLDRDVSQGTLSVTVGRVEISRGATGYEIVGGRQLRIYGTACAALLADGALVPSVRFLPVRN